MDSQLQTYYENFLGSVSNLLPGVLGAVLTLIVGWFIASTIGSLAAKLVNGTGLGERLKAQGSNIDLAKVIKKFVYYILMVIVLLVVLEMLGVKNVLAPLQEMLNGFVGFLPNIIGAGVIGFAGYLIATIASEVVGLGSGTVERYADRYGLTGEFDVTRLLKQIVFLIIFIPLLIAAFDTLNITAISDPAKMMLEQLTSAIPKILAAAIVLVVFFVIGRYVTQILRQLLFNLKADELPVRMGLGSVFGERPLSKTAADVAFFFIMFFGLITALEKLEFTQLTGVLNNVLDMSGSIFFGLVLLAAGNFVANLAYEALKPSDSFMAGIARAAILGLFLAIALSSMGVADQIINLAFGLILGAIAVAVALSYGLGGREAAGKHMAEILDRVRGK